MRLHIGKLYWPDQSQIKALKEQKIEDLNAFDVLIVGAGMSGAISAYVLSKAGYRVLLTEQNTIASGSTSANTGLIQYMSDAGLHEYETLIGKKNADRFYDWSKQAVEHLMQIAEEVSLKSDRLMEPTRSFLLAKNKSAVGYLGKEYKAQSRQGFPVELVEQMELQAMGLGGRKALLTQPDLALNPYDFVHRMIRHASRQHGLRVLEGTRYTSHKAHPSGGLTIRMSRGDERLILRCPRLLFATGYAPPKSIKHKLTQLELYKSYVIVTEKATEPLTLPGMIWEKADPYTYVRNTFRQELMIGGKDKKGFILRPSDATRRKQALLQSTGTLVEGAEQENIAYSFAAIFGESKDDLPYMGVDPDQPEVFILCGLGGNGTVYSAIGADIALQWMKGKLDPAALIFRIDR